MKDPQQPQNTDLQSSSSTALTTATDDEALSPNNERMSLKRQESDISLYDQTSSLFDPTDADGKHSIKSTTWTRKHWEALERWYVKRGRDCQEAANAFFVYESVTSESCPPLWSKDYILWRCRCLDTNTKYHHGVLPSERKQLKDKLRKMAKEHNRLKPKDTTQQQLHRKSRQQERQRHQH